jgi:hypothetical protein
MYAGWVPFWSDSPEKAHVLNFGGPLQPRLLRVNEFVAGGRLDRLSVAMVHTGDGPSCHTRLSIDAVPAGVTPQAKIDWPVAEGADPLTTVHNLSERCCYWEFYTRGVPIPANAVEGEATVTVTFPGWLSPIECRSQAMKVPVRAAKKPE